MTVKSYGVNANLALDGAGISGTDIAEEYTGNDQANVKISDYYAGGSLVPAGTTGNPSGGSAVAIPSSGQISFNNFFASTGVATFPSGTYTGRTGTAGGTSNYVTFLEENVTGIIAVPVVSTGIRLYGSTNSVEIQVRRIIAQDTSVWYNTSNSASTLSTAWQTIWQMNVLPDSVKWRLTNSTTNSGTAINSHGEANLSAVTTQLSTSYQTINTSTTLGRILQSISFAECFTYGTATRYWGVLFDFRKSGYTDALGHAEFVFLNNATSQSNNCF